MLIGITFLQSIISDFACILLLQEVLKKDYSNAGIDLLFLKEQCFSVPESMYQEILNLPDVQHTFLIRNPALTIPSFYKMCKDEIGCEVNWNEAGYRQLYDFYKRVSERSRKSSIVVIDASDLQANPDYVMKHYCESIGVPFEPHMTSWAQGPVPGVSRGWHQWVQTLEKSTGFIQIDYANQKQPQIERLSNEVQEYIEECMPYYEEMSEANKLDQNMLTTL